jgi:glucose/arabinose dehydrogenase
MVFRSWPALVLLIVLAACGSNTPNQQQPSGEQITGNERIGWNQQAIDPTELATFNYAIYVDSVRSELAGSACAASAQAGFSCSAPLPKMSPGSHTLELAAYVVDGGILESPRSAPLQVIVSPSLTTNSTATAASQKLQDGSIQTTDRIRLRVEVIATDLDSPTDLAPTPDGRIFISERSGRIRIVRDGRLDPNAAAVLDENEEGAGAGFLALAVDPHFESNHLVFAVYTTTGRHGDTTFALARFREVRDRLAERAVLVDEVPASDRPHASVRFGPDGKLFAAFDDGDRQRAAGDLASFNGKILRLNADATTPSDQAGATPVFSWEYRSPRGLDWQPSSRMLWVVDDRGVGATRLSAIAASATRPVRASLIQTYALPSVPGASSLAFYHHDLLPQFRDDLLIGSDDGRHILRLRFDNRDPARVVTTERLLQDRVGGIRALTVGADGAIYFATSHELARLVPSE